MKRFHHVAQQRGGGLAAPRASASRLSVITQFSQPAVCEKASNRQFEIPAGERW
jgi:hypothetical protein